MQPIRITSGPPMRTRKQSSSDSSDEHFNNEPRAQERQQVKDQ